MLMTKLRTIKEKVSECRHRCTELELNAYGDGELGGIEQGLVLEAASQSADIRTRLNELEQLRQWVRMSYKQI